VIDKNIYISSLADVQTSDIGVNTKVWQFCVILPKAKIGANCNICANCFIENDVVVGDNCTIKSGVQLWDGISIENNVFIGPNVTFTNDKKPKSKKHLPNPLRTKVGKFSSIGANSTILPGLSIGEHCQIGAGSVVVFDIPDYAVVVGNPGRVVKFERKNIQGTSQNAFSSKYIFALQHFKDRRGDLIVSEAKKNVPFDIKRIFIIKNVPNSKIRGAHAHIRCHQALLCLQGSFKILIDNGKSSNEYFLENTNYGVYIPPLCWSIQFDYTSDAIILALASHQYDEKDYIRNYIAYKKYLNKLNS